MVKNSLPISRRSFLCQIKNAMGAFVISDLSRPFIKSTCAKSRFQNYKKLLATTDYGDNIHINNNMMDRAQLDDLHKCIASLGVTRHQWMVDTQWTMYDDYPHGFDLLAEATESAHAHGLEFYAVIKPFEDGYGKPIPLTMPFPKDAVAFKNMLGIAIHARPFAAKHSHMCLKRRPGTYEFKGPLAAIRLIKENDSQTRVKPEHLSIWTSESNNGFVRYEGPVSFRESVEWRSQFPKGCKCRIINIEDLDIPKDHIYCLIKCSITDESGDFSNENGKIIELLGKDGKVIPHTLSKGPESLSAHKERFYDSIRHKEFLSYFKLPQVQNEINNSSRMEEHYKDFYSFDFYYLEEKKTLDQDGSIAVACGKPEYMLGNLHPIYPEVREHWLDLVRFCLDRNVDGINLRVGNHTRYTEFWEYGFNKPVLEASGGKTDYPTISRINGDAYTQFLFQARDLVKSRGKGLTIHLNAGMLKRDDRGNKSSLPPNFEWQWEKWIKEIADDLELRGGFILRPWNLRQVLDIFSAVTKVENKPFYYQTDFRGLNFGEPHPKTEQEIELVKTHSGLDGLVLYETAGYTGVNEKGRIENCPYLEELVKNKFLNRKGGSR